MSGPTLPESPSEAAARVWRAWILTLCGLGLSLLVLGLYPIAGFIMLYVGVANALNGWRHPSRPVAGPPRRDQAAGVKGVTTT